ncbi:hypothetical protein [Bdellovibrio bacteriovorus]|uniref:hypothetical protein n=1 Tax=Bdellovibrio bacteriovorus TaxID=959 RepID=UPI003AA83943
MAHLKLVPGGNNSESNNNSEGSGYFDNPIKKEADAAFVHATTSANPNLSLRELVKKASIEANVDETTFKNRFFDLKRLGYIIDTGTKKCTVSGMKVSTVAVNDSLPFNINSFKLSMRKQNKTAASVRNHDEIVAEIEKFTKKLMNYPIDLSLKLLIFEELSVLFKQVMCDVEMGLSRKRGWKMKMADSLKKIKALARSLDQSGAEDKEAA